ncbi:MAG: 3-hydroxyacyl-CoA dehydrogenase family protein [Ferruginibacter sp.]|nr:hypothetical protein [Ferruginibacter sp.]
MTIVVLSNNENWEILKELGKNVNWVRVSDIISFLNYYKASAYFNLMDNSSIEDYNALSAPVFINSMSNTLKTIQANENVIRINAWPGFLVNEIWEIAGKLNEDVNVIFTAINKKCIVVNDEPGFVSARTIAMIINEAYFAKGEAVSSQQEIDTAMKLGTNYPFGPFEWATIIGHKRIIELLRKLLETNERYLVAPALLNEINL